jgi:hypothetical protein
MGSGPQPYPVVYDTDNGLQYVFETGLVSCPTFPLSGTIVQSSTFPASAGAHSYQGIAADVTLEAASGSSSGSNPKFLAGGMFSLHGASLTKTANYLGGVIGQYDIPGTKSTTYPAGAVLGMIADGTTTADGAFVAFTDGDSSVTQARAAYTVMNNNSNAGSGFTVGLDLKGATHDGYLPVAYSVAEIRLSNGIKITSPTATTVVFTSADGSKSVTLTLV